MKKKLAILLLTIVCVCSIYLIKDGNICAADTSDIIRNDETGIPDKALYKAILEELHKDKNRTFTKREAESIEELFANISRGGEKSVASLKGIGYLRNLKHLSLEGNSLTTLAGVEELYNLEKLTVDSGLLKSLEGIETLPNLKSLSAIYNELTDLKGIENMTNLEWLHVSENDLKSLDEIKNLTNLVCISAWGCNLKKLPDLTGFDKLDAVYCSFSGNYLSEKEFRSKLPQRFFDKSSDEYGQHRIKDQIIFQNQNYKVTLTAPAKNKITKNTNKITGKAYKNSKIVLYDSTEKIKIKKTITDKKGKFVLSNLNLKKWAGKKLVIKIALLSSYGEYHPLTKTFTFKVRKK